MKHQLEALIWLSLAFTSGAVKMCYYCKGGQRFNKNSSTFWTVPATSCQRDLIRCKPFEPACAFGIVSLDLPKPTVQMTLSGCYQESYPEAVRCFRWRSELDQKKPFLHTGKTLLYANYCLCFNERCNDLNFQYFVFDNNFAQTLMPQLLITTPFTTQQPSTKSLGWRAADNRSVVTVGSDRESNWGIRAQNSTYHWIFAMYLLLVLYISTLYQ